MIETLPADSSSQRFGPTSSGSSPPAIPIGSGPEKSPPTSGVNGDKDTLLKTRKRPRCRDYDGENLDFLVFLNWLVYWLVSEKGYCMRGDLCAFDHGPDPVVVENEILPEMLKSEKLVQLIMGKD